MLNGDHCDCCAFAQQSPPYNNDGVCPKCKTEGDIKFNGGDLYCLACGSHIGLPDQPASILYPAIAAERRRSERYRDLIEELAADHLPPASTGRRLLDSALLSILRDDPDE